MTSPPEKNEILVIHGPNLNMLGKREPEVYGKATLDDINTALKETGRRLGVRVEAFQSNHEGAIVDKIQESMNSHQGLIINPGASTHTSVPRRPAASELSGGRGASFQHLQTGALPPPLDDCGRCYRADFRPGQRWLYTGAGIPCQTFSGMSHCSKSSR
jgi:hypothetical protein